MRSGVGEPLEKEFFKDISLSHHDEIVYMEKYEGIFLLMNKKASI
jgi:hypothetical protein